MAQRQALAALCDYGGAIMSREECFEVGKVATDATNKIRNLRSMKDDAGKPGGSTSSARGGRYGARTDDFTRSLRSLERYLNNSVRKGMRIVSVPAISTGRENEVVIEGVGAMVKCGGVTGSLKPGERVLVEVLKLDAERGILKVRLTD